MQRISSTRRLRGQAARRGAATLDYVLILGAMLPIAGLAIYWGGKIVRLAYEMICVLVAWPFM